MKLAPDNVVAQTDKANKIRGDRWETVHIFWSKISGMKESEYDGMQAWVCQKVLGTSVKRVCLETMSKGMIIGSDIRNVWEGQIA